MKTDCDQSLHEISDHLDSGKKLNPSTQAHLKNCPDCASFLEAWQLNGYLTNSLSTPQTSLQTVSLADQIIQQLPAKQAAKITRFAPALAAAAALAIGIFIWKSPQSQSTNPTPTTIVKNNTSPNKMPEILGEINQQQLSQTITELGQSSSHLINNSSRNIQKITSKLEYVSTNLSKIIPRPTPQTNLDTYIPTPSNQA